MRIIAFKNLWLIITMCYLPYSLCILSHAPMIKHTPPLCRNRGNLLYIFVVLRVDITSAVSVLGSLLTDWLLIHDHIKHIRYHGYCRLHWYFRLCSRCGAWACALDSSIYLIFTCARVHLSSCFLSVGRSIVCTFPTIVYADIKSFLSLPNNYCIISDSSSTEFAIDSR